MLLLSPSQELGGTCDVCRVLAQGVPCSDRSSGFIIFLHASLFDCRGLGALVLLDALPWIVLDTLLHVL